MLWELSLKLCVPVDWFFEGIKGGGRPKEAKRQEREPGTRNLL